MKPLMVVLGDPHWTSQAMHLACAIARDNGAQIEIVRLVPVNHPLDLGDAAGFVNYTARDRCALHECEATAEDYGVQFEAHACAYADYVNAVASIADQLSAAIVFAPPLSSRFSPWRRFSTWRLRRALHRPLYTLSGPLDRPIVDLGDVLSEDGERTGGGPAPAVNPAHP